MLSSAAVSAVPSHFFRDAWLIAGFDLRESMRTRRAVVLAVLYLLIASISSYTYVKAVGFAQEAKQGIGAGSTEAAVALDMAQNTAYQGLLFVLAGGDTAVAAHLATYPAMVLIFVWFSLGFLPWLIAMTSYDLIAGELHLRTVRFVALRTSRGAFVLGKLLSQVLLVAAIAGLSMLPVLVIGALFLRPFDAVATVLSLLQSWPILALFAFAVLGPVTFASQLVRGPGAARALAILLLFVLWIASLWAMLPDPIARSFGLLSPFTFKTWFFDPDLPDRLIAAVACLVMCAGYTWLGFLMFRRRDL
jgi:ABC-type transport system involved in multi-copper enzyme maturation permease subunit